MRDQVPQQQVSEDEEKIEIKEKLRMLRKRIRPYFKMLDQNPITDLDKVMTSEDNEEIPEWTLQDEIVAQAEEVLRQSVASFELKGEAMLNEWRMLSRRWNEMHDDEDIGLHYSIKHPQIEAALKMLNQALSDRITEKDSRMKSIAAATKALRSELQLVWDACYVYDEDKAHFMSKFTSQNFTEELYEAHRTELDVWKRYQKKNQALMDKLARRQQMWNEMMELEMKADDPTRFVNRGASLLKDQNTLIHVRKNLPKVEEDLLRLARNFSIDHGRIFRIHGKEIATLIAEDWAKFKEEKGKRKFDRNGTNSHAAAVPTTAVGLTPRKRPAPPVATPSIPFKK